MDTDTIRELMDACTDTDAERVAFLLEVIDVARSEFPEVTRTLSVCAPQAALNVLTADREDYAILHG